MRIFNPRTEPVLRPSCVALASAFAAEAAEPIRLPVRPFGIPAEGWAASQNARPAPRAPRFEESAARVGVGGAEITVEVED